MAEPTFDGFDTRSNQLEACTKTPYLTSDYDHLMDQIRVFLHCPECEYTEKLPHPPSAFDALRADNRHNQRLRVHRV